jgi:hypothetical protein
MPFQTLKTSVAALSQRFDRFAARECHVSPLYRRLSLGIARDPEVLVLAAHAREGQPVPNLFLATVHYLLLKGVPHPLSAFYSGLFRAGAHRGSLHQLPLSHSAQALVHQARGAYVHSHQVGH